MCPNPIECLFPPFEQVYIFEIIVFRLKIVNNYIVISQLSTDVYYLNTEMKMNRCLNFTWLFE